VAYPSTVFSFGFRMEKEITIEYTRSPFVHGITDAMDMNLGKFQEMVKDKEAWHAAVHEVPKSQTQLGS
jgi:hypothetical protein